MCIENIIRRSLERVSPNAIWVIPGQGLQMLPQTLDSTSILGNHVYNQFIRLQCKHKAEAHQHDPHSYKLLLKNKEQINKTR